MTTAFASQSKLLQFTSKTDERLSLHPVILTRGRVIFEDTPNTFTHAQGPLIVCVGLQGVVVVEMADAILVADKQNGQQIQPVVSRTRAERGSELGPHRKVHRPWGFYDSLDSGDRFLVKQIVFKPGESLSLQMHHYRADHWVVVRGTAMNAYLPDVLSPCAERCPLWRSDPSTLLAPRRMRQGQPAATWTR